MDATLDYLVKYRKNITILTNAEILSLNDNAIPVSWKEIFINDKFADRKKQLLANWAVCAEELRNTISYINENLVDLQLSFCDNIYSILYHIKNSKGGILIYEGKNPSAKKIDLRLKKKWNDLPESITGFYDSVHNGFYYFASESMGLLPVESITNLDDLEWGILEDMTEPVQIELKNSYGFFTNGMGGYVVIDTSDNKATLWWSNKAPRYNIDFWDVIDEWIVIGFEN
jgi:hypothetical protein